jgi:hypothetical protein
VSVSDEGHFSTEVLAKPACNSAFHEGLSVFENFWGVRYWRRFEVNGKLAARTVVLAGRGEIGPIALIGPITERSLFSVAPS